LGGFLLPIFLSILFHRDEEAEEDDSALPADEEECASCMGDEDVENGAAPQDRGSISAAVVISPNDSAVYDADASVDTFKDKGPPVEPIATKTKTFIDYRLGASILIGDAFHNFADGLFIGAAFLSCSWATAFSITAITLFHEMAQELADFILLTRFVGLSVFQAASLNFVSGLWVCLGGIIVLAAKPSDEAIGIMLAFAGGVYIKGVAANSVSTPVIGNASNVDTTVKVSALSATTRSFVTGQFVKLDNSLSSEILRTYRNVPTGSSITVANTETVSTYFRPENSIKYIRVNQNTGRLVFLRNGKGQSQVEPLGINNTIALANLGNGLVQVTGAQGTNVDPNTGKLSARVGDMMYIQPASPFAVDARCKSLPNTGMTAGSTPEYLGYPVVHVIDNNNIIVIFSIF
jgi:zinc transporter ZupT